MTELKFGQVPVKPEFWFLEASLYHKENYQFEDWRSHGFESYRSNILAILFPKITIDVYCPACKKETVFTPADREIDWVSNGNNIIKYGVNYTHFQCSRNHCESDLFFIFEFRSDGTIIKIGQNPSIADLVSPKINKYAAVLEKTLIADWQRAIGLRAHGVGAGSYVYLRRIIEKMVILASEQAFANGVIEKETFFKSRWSERIKLLEGYLPSYLVENSKVYSVLSKGVHELTEDECSDYFEVIHTSIEIICEEKLAELERAKKAEKGSKALQKVLQKLAD